MKVFKAEQVRAIDNFTIKNEPVESINLMERAARSFIKSFMRDFDSSSSVIVLCGPGNNGGDGLAIARLLDERFFSVEVYVLKIGKGTSSDFRLNLERLKKTCVNIHFIEQENDLPSTLDGGVIIDAVFGSGLGRNVSGLPAAVIQLANRSSSCIVSVDIPSGLFGEDNRNNNPDAIIRACKTISFQFPFLSFFYRENEVYTGNWEVVSIGLHPGAIEDTETNHILVDRSIIEGKIKVRNRFSHKGTFGHALLIAGCKGMMGAAVLASRACLRSGVGLLTTHVPRNTCLIMQSAVPESLISIDESDILFTGVSNLTKYSAVGIGPAINCKSNTVRGLKRLLEEIKVPLLIDADGLNIIAANPELAGKLPPRTILTPHPREFDRLFGKSDSMSERHEKQVEMAQKYNIYIVLKGAWSMIATPRGKSYINSTGNPGLATGGSGDVLSGIILSLLAQGYSEEEAAVLGVYLHGFAADLALDEQSEESLLPGDIINYLGKAFKILKEKSPK